MNFGSPIFFWSFLSLIPLIAIYLLKVRPVRKPTTAYFLWDNIFQEKKATSLFQRFRDLFSLLLMLFAFCAIALALTRPDFSGDDQKDLVLLIDNSASMNAKEGNSTRLDNAKTVASQIVRALNGTQRCSIATVSNEATYLSNLTDNPRELLDAISKITESSLSSNIETLNQFQKASPNPDASGKSDEDDEANKDDQPTADSELAKSDYRVVLISDGLVGGNVPDDIELIKIGNSNIGNAGIVACDMLRLPGGSNRVGVFFQIASTFEESVEGELILSHDSTDNLIKLIPLQIEPGKNVAEVFELDDAPAGKWFVQLDMGENKDVLADDNIAFLSLAKKKPIPVSVVASDRYFYENSVLAFSRTDGLLQLIGAESEAKPQLKIGAGSFPIANSDDGSSTNDFLVFQPNGESPWWSELGEEIEVTLPRTLDENHPVIRHLEPTSIPFVGAKRLAAPAGSEIWVTAEDDTPLIYRATNAGRTAVVVNLDPLASDFYFSAWFPVLVYSSATHLAGRTEAVHSTYPTGRYASIPGVKPGNETKVDGPEESKLVTTESLLGPLAKPGFYDLKNGGGDWQVACSLLSPNETSINNEEIKDTSQPINRGFSPTAWLTLIAVVVLAIESVLYQRRKVG